MYKILGISFLFFTLGCNNSSSLQDQFTLTLDISGELEGKTYLVKRDFGKWVNIDSSNINTGLIKMDGVISDPEFCYLKFGQKYVGIFLESGNILFSAHVDSLDKGIISGSKTQDELDLFKESILPITNELNDLYEKYRAINKTQNKDSLNYVSDLIDRKDQERLKATLDLSLIHI